jgi:hypothetical protein
MYRISRSNHQKSGIGPNLATGNPLLFAKSVTYRLPTERGSSPRQPAVHFLRLHLDIFCHPTKAGFVIFLPNLDLSTMNSISER